MPLLCRTRSRSRLASRPISQSAPRLPTARRCSCGSNCPVSRPFLLAVERVDPVTPAVATTVTATELQALPASGRLWQQFLLDTPAASTSADSSQASYRGSQQSAEVTIDGANTSLAFGIAAGSSVDNSDTQRSTSQSGGRSWSGGRGLGVSEAAIREVTTAAGNVEAEGMRSAGGRTSIRPKAALTCFTARASSSTAKTPGARGTLHAMAAEHRLSFSAQFHLRPVHAARSRDCLGTRLRQPYPAQQALLVRRSRHQPAQRSRPRHGQKSLAEFFTPPEPTSAFRHAAQCAAWRKPEPGLQRLPRSSPLRLCAAGLEQLAALLGPAPRTSAQWLGFAPHRLAGGRTSSLHA